MNEFSQPPITSKSSTKKYLVIGIVLVVAICALLGSAGYLYFSNLRQYDLVGANGPYSIERVVLTNELDEDGQPIGSMNIFKPSDTIIGWVGTRGAEGIIGFRFFYEDEMLFERFGKTQDNHIFGYIQSNSVAILPEGNYRLEIHTTGGTPHEVLPFRVERYKPEVVPALPVPADHQQLETTQFVEIPFVFDEVWTVEGEMWQINEVKIVFLRDEAVFPAIVVATDFNASKLSNEEAHELAKPIAMYALENGYIERASRIKIDGTSYGFDEVYVNFIEGKIITTEEEKRAGNRVPFLLEELD
jgi:hypothetical protein